MLLSLRTIRCLQTGGKPEVKPLQMKGEDIQNGGQGDNQQASLFVTGLLP